MESIVPNGSDTQDHDALQPHAFGVEILVNARSSSAYWRLDDDEQVRETYEEASEQRDALIDCDYAPEHLRIVGLVVVERPGGHS